MAKITIQVDSEEEWQRVFAYTHLVKRSTIAVERSTLEERKRHIKEFLEWTETNRVKIDGPIEISTQCTT